jgi:hypothetical protein
VRALLAYLRRWLAPISGISFLGVVELLSIPAQISSWEQLAVFVTGAGTALLAGSLRGLRTGERSLARAACGVALVAAAAVVGAYAVGPWTWLAKLAVGGAVVTALWLVDRYAEDLLPAGGASAASQLGPPPPAEPWQNVPRV